MQDFLTAEAVPYSAEPHSRFLPQRGTGTMKITAFAVRQDEQKSFDEIEKKTGACIDRRREEPSAEAIRSLERGSAVSVLGMTYIGEEILGACRDRDIRYLATRTIGYNHIDLDAARRLGIHICNVTYDPNGVADFTIMMMLLCLRNYKQALWRGQVNDFSLNGLMGRELRDLTVGIVGTGRIGACVARELQGFGCRILGSNPHEREELSHLLTYVPLEELYAESDIITLHVPLTEKTRHMINRNSIAKMKDGVILINCSRGALMDADALIDAVESCKVGALGLDVVENDEQIVHRDLRTDIFSDRDMAYLRQFKNVVHTPHMASYTDEAVRSMVFGAVQGILAMQENIPITTQLC